QVADAAPDLEGLLEYVIARHARGPAGGRHEAGQDPHGCRLARAVRAEEADDLALLDREGDVLDGRNRPVALGEAIDLDHRSSLPSRGDARWVIDWRIRALSRLLAGRRGCNPVTKYSTVPERGWTPARPSGDGARDRLRGVR